MNKKTNCRHPRIKLHIQSILWFIFFAFACFSKVAHSAPDALFNYFRSEFKKETLAIEQPLFYFALQSRNPDFYQFFSKKELCEFFAVSDGSAECLRLKTEKLVRSSTVPHPKTREILGKEEDVEIKDEFSTLEATQLLKAAADLQRMVPEGSTVLFPGRSPLWIKKAFDFLNTKTHRTYNSVHFNFSGYPDILRMKDLGWNAVFANMITPDRYEHFKKYLIQSGLNIDDPAPLTIVDYVEAGENLAGLLNILQNIYEDAGRAMPKISFIDISNPGILPDGKLPKNIHRESDQSESFYFSDSAIHPIPYRSLHLSDRNLIHFLIDPDHDSFSLGYFYPPYRWTPEYDEARDHRVFINSSRMHQNLIKQWEMISNRNGLSSFEFQQILHPSVSTLVEVQTLIEKIKSRIQGLQPSEVLFVIEINDVLAHLNDIQAVPGTNYFALPKTKYTERPGAANWIRSLFADGFQVILTTEEPAWTETAEKLRILGLERLLGSGVEPGLFGLQNCGKKYSGFRLGDAVASIGLTQSTFDDVPHYRAKALVPFVLLHPDQQKEVKKIIFVDSNEFSIENFVSLMSGLGSAYEQLQEVHLIHLTSKF